MRLPRRTLPSAALGLALAAQVGGPDAAQDLCQGNGVGEAYLEIGPAYIGGKFVHDMGSPNVPFAVVLFAVSDGFELTSTTLLGQVCLAVGSPAFALFALPTDATGNAHAEFPLPSDPLLASFPSFHSTAVTFEGGAWSVSKTAALFFQNADAWAPTQDLLTRRFDHTATALYADGRDNESRILVAGGSVYGTPVFPQAIAETEVYHPLDRSFTAGPAMAVARAWHTATRLADGRVLIAGGQDAGGACHRSCELFDPATGTLAPTGDMTTERAAHTATLLDDGRVLVAGGYQDYQDAQTDMDGALSSAQASVELYDPATGTWSALATPMSEPRAAHTATRLDDGSVLLVGGIMDGMVILFGPDAVPVFATTVDRFDPGSGQLVPEAALPLGRADHGAGLLADGRVLVTGGLQTYTSTTWGPVDTCLVWDGAGWSPTASLPAPLARHAQAALADGAALVVGGTGTGWISPPVGSSSVGRHDGTAYAPLTDLALNPGLPGSTVHPRCAMTITPGYDGTFVVLGGYGLGSPLQPPANGYLGFVYTPAP